MISVVMGTYNRAHLLYRSLICYEQSTLPKNEFELIIVDDWSTDNTQDLVETFSKRLNIVYMRPYWKENGVWRDSSSFLNMAIRAASGNLIIGTHPEVMPGKKTLQALQALEADNYYIAAKPYYLSPSQQDLIDTVNWQEDGINAIRTLPDFYAPPPMAAPVDYSASAIENSSTWESWVFGGMTKNTWQQIGGLPAFSEWGAVDIAFLNRRARHQITTIHPAERDAYVVHQNHDITAPSPRNIDLAMEKAAYDQA